MGQLYFNYSTYDYQYTEGYSGFIMNDQSLSPEKFALYCLRDKKEINPYSWQSISYYYYYSSYISDANRSKPVRIYFFEKDSLKNNTKFCLERDAETHIPMLHVECSSAGAAGSVKCTVMYRKKDDKFWTNCYFSSASFDIMDYPDCQFKTVITDEAGNTKESSVFEPGMYVPRTEPYIDETGEYHTGAVEHYVYNDKNYEVNADGSRGKELSDVTLSYFVFEPNTTL